MFVGWKFVPSLLYWYVPVPPVLVKVTVDGCPLHKIAVLLPIKVNNAGSVMVIGKVLIQLFSSFTLNVYVPAGRFANVFVG